MPRPNNKTKGELTMDMCSNNHPEIVYDSRFCPLCEALDEKGELENLLQEAKDQLADARREAEN